MSSYQKLFVAKEKLQDSDIPLKLRVLYYLRMACDELEPDSLVYEDLTQMFSNLNPNWVDTCEVTSLGELKSSDRAINRILLTIEQFYRWVASTVEYIPMAA